ncbi:MAG: ABC transporter substrate-binding protein [Desulfobacteraceae bacterium]|jgi:TRAP-type C4-dicarboxylate transport system substrate-binding protein|nr:MAG: ABC transporter substrate-binding protein [Desulfobacteraceae bacterium]
MKKIMMIIIALNSLFFLAGMGEFANFCKAAAPDYIVKFATVAPDGSAWMKKMKEVDAKVRAETSNRLGFAFYPGGVAGDEIDVLKKIRIGQIHCAAFSGVGFGQILPMVRVLDLPFLFRSYDEVDLIHMEMKDFFSAEFRKKGFDLLAWAEVGNVHILSKKPIRSVIDFTGLKIWSWSGDPVARETFLQMGVTPITLPITDVTTALNTGMIDTVYAPPLGALALQWHSVLSYMTEWPLVHATGAVLISSRFLERLPQDLSKILIKNMDAAMKELTMVLRSQGNEAIGVLRKSGVAIAPSPSNEDMIAFSKIHERVAKELTEKIYPADLLDRIYRILRGIR